MCVYVYNWKSFTNTLIFKCSVINSVELPGGSVIKNLPAVQEARVQSLGREDPLEQEMANHSSIAWKIP